MCIRRFIIRLYAKFAASMEKVVYMRYIYRLACGVSVGTTVLETKRVHKRTSHRDAEKEKVPLFQGLLQPATPLGEKLSS